LWLGSDSRLSTPVTVEMNSRKLSPSTKSKKCWVAGPKPCEASCLI
jgi:hypothetical protein